MGMKSNTRCLLIHGDELCLWHIEMYSFLFFFFFFSMAHGDWRWTDLSIQLIHITLPQENFDAPRWTATAFSDKSSVIGSHVGNDLVNHFNLKQAKQLGEEVSKAIN